MIFGAISGFLAYAIMGMRGQGCLMNIVLGIVGAFVGGGVFSFFGGSGFTGFNPYSLFVSVIGAIVVIVIARLLGGHKR